LNLADSSFLGESAELAPGKAQEEPQDEQYDELVASAETVAVSISGGGLNFSTSQKFDTDEFIQLEIFVPSSRLIVDVVARVVFSSSNARAGDCRISFNTGLQFVFIDESSRLAINNHISSIQLKRIRHFKGFTDVEPLCVESIPRSDKQYAYINRVDDSGTMNDVTRITGQSVFQQLFLGLFFVCVVSLIGFYFSWYAVKHPKNEIQKIFEHGIALKESVTIPAGLPASGR
jgi:hypothetical protein